MYISLPSWTGLEEYGGSPTYVLERKLGYMWRVPRKKRDNLLVETDIFCHFRGIIMCNAKRLQFH